MSCLNEAASALSHLCQHQSALGGASKLSKEHAQVRDVLILLADRAGQIPCAPTLFRCKLPAPALLRLSSFLPFGDAAKCDAVATRWRAVSTLAWFERCLWYRGKVETRDSKREYMELFGIAKQGLKLITSGDCTMSITNNVQQAYPQGDNFWVAFFGEPSRQRRFVALKIHFAWSWCCNLGVIDAGSSDSPLSADDVKNTELWRVTARPPSRFEEGTLAIEGLNDVQADVKLLPRRGPLIHYESENSRFATFGILIDDGGIAFFMRSKRGVWSTTGIVARNGGKLVPFVAHPVQHVELLHGVEPPEIPLAIQTKVASQF